MKYLITALFLFGCHKPNPDSQPKAPAERFAAIEDRIAAMSWPTGWVSCTDIDGGHGCLGDSLLFTGLALGAADCEHGQIYQDALTEMIHANNGILERHPTIRGSSLDGALGFLWGMARRYANCPDARAATLESVRLYASNSSGTLEPYFSVVLRQVLADMGDGDSPSEHDRGMLGSEIAGWAFAVVTSESAAYRIHLGYLGLSLVDSPKGRVSYCAAVEKAKIPLIESFCGRPGLTEWIDGFLPNVYEFRHQRAIWEGPDANGKQTPGVDYLVGYRQAFGFAAP